MRTRVAGVVQEEVAALPPPKRVIIKKEDEKDKTISVPAAIKKIRRSKCKATEEVQPTCSAQKETRGCASIEQLIAQPCPYVGAEKNFGVVRARNRKKKLDEKIKPRETSSGDP